ncbi:MAG TPA: hypothetical protein VGG16_24410 [Streptosporangiaceae bacterium]
MAVASGPGLPGSQISLLAHAQRLHAEHPDSPLPADGYPFPDDPQHCRQPRPRPPKPYSRAGADAAAVLDEHFTRADAGPADLEHAFHDVYVPIHWNEHIAAAAWRAGEQRVRETGRWLVTHSRDRCSATIGLALLAAGLAEDDIALIRTLGLLSDRFGPLAARALVRRRATDALLWLADRVAGWGRVYVVEALCDFDPYTSRSWLLRRACDGDFLNGYFAGKVATAAHLHEAITSDTADDGLIDHAGRLLRAMTDCAGMGMTLAAYPPARAVIAAHASHLGRQQPTFSRWTTAAILAGHLTGPGNVGFSEAERQGLGDAYASVLNRADWTAVAQADMKKGDDHSGWIRHATRSIRLNAFTEPPDDELARDLAERADDAKLTSLTIPRRSTCSVSLDTQMRYTLHRTRTAGLRAFSNERGVADRPWREPARD